ncbi:MAG: carbamoyltransferase HypF [Gammaproteobacteria bacterium]|nr:carbamoyltransferase HypF [Gammaproteobacteria bacterium]
MARLDRARPAAANRRGAVSHARHIRVGGIVQGVGFRPFVWRLAHELELRGWVRNDSEGVEISAEGPAARLDALIARLASDAPPLARIDSITAREVRPAGHAEFAIAASVASRCATAIGPDTATCPACLEELFDPHDRRWRHALITCTHCGPRYTIAFGLPYDRARTSMAGFAMCADCAREYRDPADRRFHAEPVACPACGPRLRFLDRDGADVGAAADAGRGLPASTDPIARSLECLRGGGIVAIKGLGGYHLACDARNPRAVAALRARKARDAKPFALMVANAASLDGIARADGAARRWLESPERPIVLVPKDPAADGVLPGIADGLDHLGVMLPATPIQWLLFHEAAGRPSGTAWLAAPSPEVWVMTSANPGGEPLVIDDADALRRLGGIADAYLLHDRPIAVRCDDSVRFGSEAPRFLRRARGYTPEAIRLPAAGPPVLALGAGLKTTVCVTRGDEAFLSQHVGDLDDAASIAFLEECARHLCALLDVEPQRVAHDLHPDFPSTRLALQFAADRGATAIAVGHHHAHVAAVAAEHRWSDPLLGLALDGVGLGPDGEAWGGELLEVTGATCRRLGHLATLPLPGGDRAAREPWRVAAGALHRLGRGAEIPTRFARQRAARGVGELLERDLRCPATSSAGRWFDAAAALLGVAETAGYEAQPAMRLEALARRYGTVSPAPLWRIGPAGRLDLLPLLETLADWRGTPEHGAALFHATFAAALCALAIDAAAVHRRNAIALCGGCLCNGVLREALSRGLAAAGLEVLHAERAPPNDGAISLGQAWVALATGRN